MTALNLPLHTRWLEDEQETFVPTGSMMLDRALGGGLPLGKLTEVFGREGSGKTTLALSAALQAQSDGHTAYIDSEHKLCRSRVKQLGVDCSHTLFIRSAEAVETLNILLELTLSGQFRFVIVDSLAGLLPLQLIEESGPSQADALEHILERALPRIAVAAARTNTCVLLLNQVRESDDVTLSDTPTFSPGGHVLRHTCSVRIHLTSRYKLKTAEGTIFGTLVRARVGKNLLGPPGQDIDLPITYAKGLDRVYDGVLELQRRAKVSGKSAIEYRGVTLGTTEVLAYEYLLHHPTLASTLITDKSIYHGHTYRSLNLTNETDQLNETNRLMDTAEHALR